MRAVKPTRAQKIFIEKRKLESKNGLVLEDTDEHMKIAHKGSGSVKTVKKGAK